MSASNTLTVRVRSLDGLERVKVRSDGSVLDLKRSIEDQLFEQDANAVVGDHDDRIVALSMKPALLTTKDDVGFCPEEFQDMVDENEALDSLGIGNGTIVYMLTSGPRQVRGVKLPSFMENTNRTCTLEDMIARQTRIERQETAACSSVSFDMHAANAFQAYVSSLGFHNKRGGILYGQVSDGKVYVHAIYEPEQQCSIEGLHLERSTPQETRADAIARAWGWTKVGQVFSISAKSQRDYMFSAEEVMGISAIQEELGELAVTGVVSQEPPNSDDDSSLPEVHFEAFQVSKQCVELNSAGWFSVGDAPNEFRCVNPNDKSDKTPVIVNRVDQGSVDVDYFLVPVAIDSHMASDNGFLTEFPIENRLTGQSSAELKAHIHKHAGKPFADCLKDFHLMLYVADQGGLAADETESLAATVLAGQVPDGYQMIIRGMAGM